MGVPVWRAVRPAGHTATAGTDQLGQVPPIPGGGAEPSRAVGAAERTRATPLGAWCTCPNTDRPLALACRPSAGHDDSLMLLTSLAVPPAQQARNVLRSYRWWWGYEEVVKWLE